MNKKSFEIYTYFHLQELVFHMFVTKYVFVNHSPHWIHVKAFGM